ncbi:hypothetical protein DFH28DRAFT_537958 [Melampsora americana]|nr:hypothetical protein DFH28DRAFT_537958 [Melampsora americana]
MNPTLHNKSCLQRNTLFILGKLYNLASSGSKQGMKLLDGEHPSPNIPTQKSCKELKTRSRKAHQIQICKDCFASVSDIKSYISFTRIPTIVTYPYDPRLCISCRSIRYSWIVLILLSSIYSFSSLSNLIGPLIHRIRLQQKEKSNLGSTCGWELFKKVFCPLDQNFLKRKNNQTWDTLFFLSTNMFTVLSPVNWEHVWSFH